jgi:two-component system CheB/CheR fusion protein
MPYRTRDNRIAGVVMTFIDITALKRSEQEAMLAQSLAESALNLVEQPLLVVDAGLTIGTANRAFLAHFGLARDDVLGRTIEDLSGNLWEREELERVTGPIIGEERSVSEASVNVRAGGDAEVPATVRARAIPSPRAESARILISFSFPRSSSS